MKIGHAYAWGGSGSVPAQQAFGGTQRDGTQAVAAGGMEYEDGNPHPATNTRFVCKAIKKDGEQCESWAARETPYCQGHLHQLEKLERKIASCEDEAERLLLEEERVRKWL